MAQRRLGTRISEVRPNREAGREASVGGSRRTAIAVEAVHGVGVCPVCPQPSDGDRGRAAGGDLGEAGNQRVNAYGLVGDRDMLHGGAGCHLNIDEQRIVRPHRGACAHDVRVAMAAREQHGCRSGRNANERASTSR